MIALIIILIMLLFFVVKNCVHDKLMKNVLYAFLVCWLVALLLSELNPYGLHSISESTYFILFIYIISFVFGCIFLGKNECKFLKKERIVEKIGEFVSNKIFCSFVFLCDIFLLYLYEKEQSLLAVYSTAEMRVDLDELLYEGNSFLGLGKNMIIDPLAPMMTFFSAYLLLFNRKKFVPLILVLVYAIIAALLGGSRGGILRLATYGFFILISKNIINDIELKISKKMLLSFFFIITMVLVIMSNMTAQRLYGVSGFSLEGVLLGSDDLLNNFITYSTGPFRALEYSFSNNYLEILGGYKYGSCSLGFVDGLLSLVLKIIGIKHDPGYKIVSSYLQDHWIYIGNKSFNFAYTASFMHYMDFGYCGIIICPFLFGFCFRKIINRFYKSNNIFLLIMVAYLFTVAIDSLFTWRLYRHTAGVTFIYLFFLYWLTNKAKYTN